MKYHGIEMIGKFFAQQITTLPTWTPSDEGRVLYTTDTDSLYFGTATGWNSTDVYVDTVTGVRYRLYVSNGNIQLKEVVII
jgi:hypothetical protein